MTVPVVTPTATPRVTLELTPEPQPFLSIETIQTVDSVNDVAVSDDGRYAVVIQGVRLSLYDTLLDEVTPIGPRSGQVLAAAISPDGQTIAFWGALESLNEIPEVEECRNPLSPYCGALFIYDVATGMTNTIPFGLRVGGLGGLQPGVSVANNGTIAVSADGIIHSGTFLIDREGELLSLSSEAIAVSLSSAGRYLAYITSEGAFVYDADIGASTQVTAESPGIVPFHEGAAAAIDISDNGRFVVFVSESANFAGVPVEPCLDYIGRELPYCRHVYLIDRELNQSELISVSGSGEPANGVSGSVYVSADGRLVVFDSFANNLTGVRVCEEQSAICPQVYLRDRQEGRTYLLTQPVNGQLPNDGSFASGFSRSGKYVSIVSGATNLTGSIGSESFYSRKGFILDLPIYLSLFQE